MNILFIEDDIVDCMAFERLARQLIPNIKITSVNTIDTAKSKLENFNFDWVISDFNLPDGIVNDILENTPNDTTIVVSGELEKAEIAFLKSKGVLAYLVKDQSLKYIHEIARLISYQSNENKWHGDTHKPTKLIDELNVSFQGDKDAIFDLLQLFDDRIASQDFSNLKGYLNSRDISGSAYLAHRLKSSYRIFGKKKAVLCLEKIEEELLKDQNWKKIDAHFENFEKIHLLLCTQVKQALITIDHE